MDGHTQSWSGPRGVTGTCVPGAFVGTGCQGRAVDSQGRTDSQMTWACGFHREGLRPRRGWGLGGWGPRCPQPARSALWTPEFWVRLLLWRQPLSLSQAPAPSAPQLTAPRDCPAHPSLCLCKSFPSGVLLSTYFRVSLRDCVSLFPSCVCHHVSIPNQIRSVAWPTANLEPFLSC